MSVIYTFLCVCVFVHVYLRMYILIKQISKDMI